MSDYLEKAGLTFSSVYTEFTEHMKELELKPANAAKILTTAMTVVEFQELRGEEQKFLALELVKRVVSEMQDGTEKTILMTMLENDVLDDMAEAIILATKGELQINEMTQSLKSRCC